MSCCHSCLDENTWTPNVVAEVSITVVVSISRVVARHVDEVSGGVTVTWDIAQVKSVGEMFVVERDLG